MGVGGVCVVSDTAVYNAPNVNAGGGFMFFRTPCTTNVFIPRVPKFTLNQALNAVFKPDLADLALTHNRWCLDD